MASTPAEPQRVPAPLLAAGPLLALLLWWWRRDARGDWHFLVAGAADLAGPHPWHVYAAHPEVQVGPLSLAAAGPLRLLPGDGLRAAQALIWVLVAALVALVAHRAGPERRALVALATLLAVPGWLPVVTSGHLDEALAVTGSCAAALLVARRPRLAGLLLGAAAASKPWAVAAAPLLLGAPRGRRTGAAAAAATAGLVPWLPFVLGDRATLHALAAFRIPLADGSGLHHLLGLPAQPGYPAWVRPFQLAAAALLAALAWRRRGAVAVPLTAFAVRLVLDPGVAPYYGAGVVAGALLLDAAPPAVPPGAQQDGRPWRSAAALVGLGWPALVTAALAVQGRTPQQVPLLGGLLEVLRLLVPLLLVAAALLPAAGARRTARCSAVVAGGPERAAPELELVARA